MVVVGDLIELTNEGHDSDNFDILKNLDNIPWKIRDGSKIPIEILSLYSTNSGTVTINDVSVDIFDALKKSAFSHIYVQIEIYEEMFILFFEFAIEIGIDEFEFVHFGFVPTNDFFNTLSSNPIIKIKTKNFKISEFALKKILEKLNEFNLKYPNNSQF